ncbi:MAG: aminotransferase class I/II-fold pyridoxal phosphate-dependent enzyme, partial [Epsilonproteobacteria bacterium]|nr:aminotransferase class I/II-fold pyridoxal phosphate-dependent enzyme [Campylobacterota bacterium]
RIIEAQKDGIVVVDGAYMEYAKAKSSNYFIEPKELLKYDNVIYLGTFSKAFGLGGMRVGYGIGRKELIKLLYKVRPPFNITTLSLVAACEALNDMEFVKEAIELNFKEMNRYIEFAKKYNFEYIDSATNFITYLFGNNLNSTYIANELLKRGVIIRDLAGYNLNGIRITIGKERENQIFFEKFQEVLRDGDR